MYADGGRVKVYEPETQEYLTYQLSKTFDKSTSQKEFYDAMEIRSLVQRVLLGESALVVACGQRDAGKTYTMLGYHYAQAERDLDVITDMYFQNVHNDERVGLTPRCIRELYHQLYQFNAYK